MSKAHPPQWLADAVAEFGDATKTKLAGAGDREAAIRAPLEQLLTEVGMNLSVKAVFHDEFRDNDRRVRPDYGVSVNGAITGYIEVKAPGRTIDPSSFTGHDRKQWERQKDLPNLLYTNGTKWRLYRDEQQIGEEVVFSGGSLDSAGTKLTPPPEFEALITDFLKWKPAPITSVRSLVRAIAPLTRLLRGEVLDQLQDESRAIKEGADPLAQPFHGLAKDWRALLFPTADNATFADGYAQAVVFALLLARTEDIDISALSLHEVGSELLDDHSLMGRALQLLTGDVEADFKVVLHLLVRVIGAVKWERIRSGRQDTYMHLYEHFLEEYDHDLRKASGSYYTPREVVTEMVRLTEEVLTGKLNRPGGFKDPSVQTIDPAMGTGTFLHTILERIAEQTERSDGIGAVPAVLEEVVQRLIGFEIQMGPFAVAELRASDLMAKWDADLPKDGLNLFVADTLDDPYAEETQIASTLYLIAKSRRKANEVKREENVTVVIGNPPYKDQAKGMGSWVESGDPEVPAKRRKSILDDFKYPGNWVHERHLKSMYVYFYRWATWKVWESVVDTLSDSDNGVVCFITTAGYVRGPGFKGMRKYLRENAAEGWIIDLTPEGHTPDIPTRIFPQVRQPLAIGIFVRTPNTSTSTPARIHYRSVTGLQADKFQKLQDISIDDNQWAESRSKWAAPFTPSSFTGWDESPALDDLFTWTAGGIKASRTWIYAPTKSILDQRWRRVVHESDESVKRRLFHESPGVTLHSKHDPLPGKDTSNATDPFLRESGALPEPLRVSYRAFDRQWIIPDARLMQRPGQLWDGRIPGQIFMIEQHAEPVSDGAGVIFTTHIPELHYFNGRGGRALPLYHPDGSPNLAPGFLTALSKEYGFEVTAEDFITYVAAVTAHSGFTQKYSGELETPGVRVPLTADPQLFQEAAALGAEVIWTHTYGEAFSSSSRPANNIRYPHGDPLQPVITKPIKGLPDVMTYDPSTETLHLGTGAIKPVAEDVWEYSTARKGSGGRNVLKSWVNYRKDNPEGTKKSPLDQIHESSWTADWNTELLDLLTLLTRLTELEPQQDDLLKRITSSPLIDVDQLEGAGVVFPETEDDRKPRKGVAQLGGAEEGTLDLDGL